MTQVEEPDIEAPAEVPASAFADEAERAVLHTAERLEEKLSALRAERSEVNQRAKEERDRITREAAEHRQALNAEIAKLVAQQEELGPIINAYKRVRERREKETSDAPTQGSS